MTLGEVAEALKLEVRTGRLRWTVLWKADT